MKNRFVITEIYSDGIHAVNKVLVDKQTKVQYLLHQEGSTMSICPLIQADGKPVLSDMIEEHPLMKNNRRNIIKEEDKIKVRPEDEELIVLPPVKVEKDGE